MTSNTLMVDGPDQAEARLILAHGAGQGPDSPFMDAIAEGLAAAGIRVIRFPFHPPGKPERRRGGHLADIRTPTLICQGERDPFGRRDEVAGYALSPAVALRWIDDGEHSFKPRRASGRTLEDNLAQAAEAAAGFVARLAANAVPDGAPR